MALSFVSFSVLAAPPGPTGIATKVSLLCLGVVGLAVGIRLPLRRVIVEEGEVVRVGWFRRTPLSVRSVTTGRGGFRPALKDPGRVTTGRDHRCGYTGRPGRVVGIRVGQPAYRADSAGPARGRRSSTPVITRPFLTTAGTPSSDVPPIGRACEHGPASTTTRRREPEPGTVVGSARACTTGRVWSGPAPRSGIGQPPGRIPHIHSVA